MGDERQSISVSLHLLHMSVGDSCGSKSFYPGHLTLSWADPLLHTPLCVIQTKSTKPGGTALSGG